MGTVLTRWREDLSVGPSEQRCVFDTWAIATSASKAGRGAWRFPACWSRMPLLSVGSPVLLRTQQTPVLGGMASTEAADFCGGGEPWLKLYCWIWLGTMCRMATWIHGTIGVQTTLRRIARGTSIALQCKALRSSWMLPEFTLGLLPVLHPLQAARPRIQMGMQRAPHTSELQCRISGLHWWRAPN